jgi:hypothetical protein
MQYPLEGRRQQAQCSGYRALEAMAAPIESDAPEAWDFLEVLSSPGSGALASGESLRGPDGESRGDLINLLDWLAHFTRDHFDRSIQWLHESRAGRDYILQRMREHAEIRRRLATLCVEATFDNPVQAMPRIRKLCLELLLDAEAHAERPSSFG